MRVGLFSTDVAGAVSFVIPVNIVHIELALESGTQRIRWAEGQFAGLSQLKVEFDLLDPFGLAEISERLALTPGEGGTGS